MNFFKNVHIAGARRSCSSACCFLKVDAAAFGIKTTASSEVKSTCWHVRSVILRVQSICAQPAELSSHQKANNAVKELPNRS